MTIQQINTKTEEKSKQHGPVQCSTNIRETHEGVQINILPLKSLGNERQVCPTEKKQQKSKLENKYTREARLICSTDPLPLLLIHIIGMNIEQWSFLSLQLMRGRTRHNQLTQWLHL